MGTRWDLSNQINLTDQETFISQLKIQYHCYYDGKAKISFNVEMRFLHVKYHPLIRTTEWDGTPESRADKGLRPTASSTLPALRGSTGGCGSVGSPNLRLRHGPALSLGLRVPRSSPEPAGTAGPEAT